MQKEAKAGLTAILLAALVACGGSSVGLMKTVLSAFTGQIASMVPFNSAALGK